MSSEAERPTRVAVIGGGCAALTAAYELTRPELEGRYTITVYQLGFRLGGKGASGRGRHGRIEEHGLHLWMGYYENAFQLMRECYAEIEKLNPVFGSFEEAFSPAHSNGAMDFCPDGQWRPWRVHLPPMPGLPGEPNAPRLGVTEYLIRAARLLRTLLASLPLEAAAKNPAGADLPPRGPAPDPDELAALLARFTKYGAAAGLRGLIEASYWLELVFGRLGAYPQGLVARLVDWVADLARGAVEQLLRDDEVRRLWEVAELLIVTLRGCLRFRLAFDPRGFDAIDDYDCRDWLKLNGASPRALDSAFVRAFYDLAFAYEAGDPARPAIAAGAALRGAFRAFFSYRGAFFWKMHAGMGDAVFAPLYWLLRYRGVRFRFFHKLTDVGVAVDGESKFVSYLDFDVQADTARAGAEYDPLCEVRGLPSWPAQPNFAQLRDGPELAARHVDFESQWDPTRIRTRRLDVGADFDFVVLGVGLGVLPHVGGQLAAHDPRFREQWEKVKAVPTQAFQLWLRPSLAELGWIHGSINLSGFVEPFDTWADMTHLVRREDWPEAPQTLAYFCNVLDESALPPHDHESGAFVTAASEHVRKNCIQFLNTEMAAIWPRAHDSGQFTWKALLHTGPETEVGAERFCSQYWTANVRPSDLYSQALPGTTRFRLSPLDRSFDNLTLAGDWTNSGINMGCVEAAVMSGRLAAHAISGLPRLDDIAGYDHP